MEKTKKNFLERPYLSLSVISLVIYIATELINQRGIAGVFKYIISSPYAFVLNLAIVMLTMCVGLFFKRRLFCYVAVTVFWTIMAVINLIVLIQRNTQFNCSDILIFRYGIFITSKYLSLFHAILIAVGLVAVAFAVVFLFRKGYRCRDIGSLKVHGIVTGALVVIVVAMGLIGNLTGLLMPRFTNITEGYSKNGFIYAFFCSVAETGVDQPEEFSPDSVEGIISRLPEEDAKTDERPNVVFVQLETFIDPNELVGVEFDTDPVPNFNRLIDQYPSGYLDVSVLGGGTANTEFEVMTGMNINHFGTIEYPYESFLDENSCESMAYNYKALGYSAHAIHNFSAGFYRRNIVFQNLGFDTFTTFEYMTDLEYNEMGWAKDTILERYIMTALESTDTPDYIHTISVQGHGSYPTDFADLESDINTTYLTEDINEHREQLDYYISQLSEMDDFVGSLVNTLAGYDEPTVVVFYGDHLPGIALTEEMLATGSLYRTEYVIWSNFEIEAEDRDLATYQLAAHTQSLIGLSSGKITKLHQTFMDDEKYEDYLITLEYDITQGDMLTYGGENPFEPGEMTFGLDRIYINELSYEDKTLYISGENFNEHSAVYVNGSRKTTEYIDKNTLMVKGIKLKEGTKVSVAQMSYQMPWSYLSMTEEYEY
ncbi:MAG: LTA synthase family protein [Clostridia bacterium]|nr:LTA synthase family protein [Clostridia bacterium]